MIPARAARLEKLCSQSEKYCDLRPAFEYSSCSLDLIQIKIAQARHEQFVTAFGRSGQGGLLRLSSRSSSWRRGNAQTRESGELCADATNSDMLRRGGYEAEVM